jgi:hypothetical protein
MGIETGTCSRSDDGKIQKVFPGFVVIARKFFRQKLFAAKNFPVFCIVDRENELPGYDPLNSAPDKITFMRPGALDRAYHTAPVLPANRC